jgi:tetratricopeptide (TPR) repeat protein
LSLAAIAIVVSVAGMAYGAKGADKRAADNSRLDTKTRIEACTRLLALDDLSKTERAWALLKRGYLYRRKEKFAEALVDFEKAEKIDPGNPRLHRERAYVHYSMKKYPETDAELTKAIKLDPRNAWSWYVRGRVYTNQRKYDDALKAYDKALALSPRYFLAYDGRARLNVRRKDYPKAIEDCEGMLALDPYYASAYTARGSAYALTDKPNLGIRDHAIALSLDPNLDGPERDLKKLVEKATAAGPASGPAEFKQPKKGLSFSYLMTVKAKTPKKDEMEEAIGGLMGWFKKKRVPKPKFRAFLLREVAGGKDNLITIKPSNKYPNIDRKKAPVKEIDYYRALWPTILPMGNTGEVLDIEYEKAPLDALWPLKVGNKGKGTAKLFFVGPDPLTPPAKFFGCKKPGDRIPFGQINWTGGVTGREKVTVPAGVFNTLVIRFEQEMELVMMGRSQKRTIIVTWWYAPSVRWWVKRTQESGPDIITNEAETIK